MREVVRSAFHEFSGPLEGRELRHMYLDSVGINARGDEDGTGRKGLVTTATGCLIDPVSMATGHPWLHPDGRLASLAEIVACWSLVKARQDLRRHGGMIYDRLEGNTLRLSPDAARNLVDRRLTWFDAELSQVFPDYESWPACAQLFALSWSWAVGVHARYPRMIAALNKGDYETAAEECTITPQRGTIVKRNAANRILLRNAARVRDFKLDHDEINWKSVIGVSDAETQPDLTGWLDADPPSQPTHAASQPTIHPVADTLDAYRALRGEPPPDDDA